MYIENEKHYIQDIIGLIFDTDFISSPKNPAELFDGKIHKNTEGEIVGWVINSKEIKFWDEGMLDVDEYAERNNQNKITELSSFSYHFQPDNETLKSYRIDKDYDDIHANSSRFSELDDHLSPAELKLKITKFNLIISIYIAMKYIKNEDKYPLLDENANFYNKIIDGKEGEY